jgi:hypothetical protein
MRGLVLQAWARSARRQHLGCIDHVPFYVMTHLCCVLRGGQCLRALHGDEPDMSDCV